MKKYREIAVFVTGTTPQIVTETLYALQEREERVLLDEIHIITTTTGKESIERDLINSGRLRDFFEEFGMPYVQPAIQVLTGSSGNDLVDIRTAEDNEAAGDFIVKVIREKTADEKARLHCSLAGGRKTMSFYMGAALSLLGRPQDRLYHVLISPEFESHREFYWKPREDKTLTPPDLLLSKRRSKEILPPGKTINIPPLGKRGRGGVMKQQEGIEGVRLLNTGDAEITLAELPFVRLRDKFSLNGKGFRELVAEGQKEIDTASAQLPLELNLAARTLRIGNVIIDMVPMHIVIYNAFLREKLKRCAYPERVYCHDCTDCFKTIVDITNRRVAQEMIEDYEMLYGAKSGRVEESIMQKKKELEMDRIRQEISKINKTIREHLKDETISSLYLISPVGKYGSKRYGVRVEKGKIKA